MHENSVAPPQDSVITSQEIIPSPPMPTPTPAQTELPAAAAASPAKPASPIPARARAPSFAEVVSGVATTEPKAAPRSPRKSSIRDAFTEVSDTIGASMDRILSKTKEGRTHAEIELSCLIRKIQTQLKIMGKFTGDMRVAQVKAMKKLKQAEAEKRGLKEENEKLAALFESFGKEKEALHAEFLDKTAAKEAEWEKSMKDLRSEIAQLKSTNESLEKQLGNRPNVEAETRSDSEVPHLHAKIAELEKTVARLSAKPTTSSPTPRQVTSCPRSSRKAAISRKSFVLYSAGVVAASASIYAGLNDGFTVPSSVFPSHDIARFTSGISPSSAVDGLARALASLSSIHSSPDASTSIVEPVLAPVTTPDVIEAPVIEVAVHPEVDEPVNAAIEEMTDDIAMPSVSDIEDIVVPDMMELESVAVSEIPDIPEIPASHHIPSPSLPAEDAVVDIVREEFVGVFEPTCNKNESVANAVCEVKWATPVTPVVGTDAPCRARRVSVVEAAIEPVVAPEVTATVPRKSLWPLP
ncbi:hypothetical protein PINS_up023521 [Pythium insidiosum]|nr:hypothetical protein PINS_up023521 [Pythium insidiosum]